MDRNVVTQQKQLMAIKQTFACRQFVKLFIALFYLCQKKPKIK